MNVEEDRSIYMDELSEEEKKKGLDVPLKTKILKTEVQNERQHKEI